MEESEDKEVKLGTTMTSLSVRNDRESLGERKKEKTEVEVNPVQNNDNGSHQKTGDMHRSQITFFFF